jgi:hypothetical protein
MGMIIDESETQFQHRVTQLAEDLGWHWLHLGHDPRGRNNQGPRGTLVKGFPDLMMVRGERMIFAELKAQRAPRPTVTQQLVLFTLAGAGASAYIWRPSDWPQILHVLT